MWKKQKWILFFAISSFSLIFIILMIFSFADEKGSGYVENIVLLNRRLNIKYKLPEFENIGEIYYTYCRDSRSYSLNIFGRLTRVEINRIKNNPERYGITEAMDTTIGIFSTLSTPLPEAIMQEFGLEKIKGAIYMKNSDNYFLYSRWIEPYGYVNTLSIDEDSGFFCLSVYKTRGEK